MQCPELVAANERTIFTLDGDSARIDVSDFEDDFAIRKEAEERCHPRGGRTTAIRGLHRWVEIQWQEGLGPRVVLAPPAVGDSCSDRAFRAMLLLAVRASGARRPSQLEALATCGSLTISKMPPIGG